MVTWRMFAMSTEPGRVVIRSRAVPTRILVLLLAAGIPFVGICQWVGRLPPPTRVAELDCRRASGKCVLHADGDPIDEVALDRVAGAEARALRQRLSASLVLTLRDGALFVVVPGDRRARLQADAATIRAFLSDPGSPALSLRWDHGPLPHFAPVFLRYFSFLLLLPAAWLALPRVATFDRLGRTLTIRTLRTRSWRLEAFGEARIQTAAEEAEARARARTWPRAAWLRTFLAPPRNPRQAEIERVVLVGRDGSTLPVSVFTLEKPDLAPALEAVKTTLLG